MCWSDHLILPWNVCMPHSPCLQIASLKTDIYKALCCHQEDNQGIWSLLAPAPLPPFPPPPKHLDRHHLALLLALCHQYLEWHLCCCLLLWIPCCRQMVPTGSPSHGGDVPVYVWYKPTQLAYFFLFCSCICFYLCGTFNCISFHRFSWQLYTFQLCSSGLISALLVLLTIYLFMKVSFSPGIIHCGWLGSKHQLTN